MKTRYLTLALPNVATMTLLELANEFADMVLEEEEGYTFTGQSIEDAKKAIEDELEKRQAFQFKEEDYQMLVGELFERGVMLDDACDVLEKLMQILKEKNA
jgi:valyl-tRNA synthetase